MNRYFTLILAVCLSFSTLLSAKEWLTIYNENLALVRSQKDIALEKGSQMYEYNDITSRIFPASVVVKSTGDPVTVAEQNYEYDLASSDEIIKKYLDREVTVITKDQKVTTGIMKFNDNSKIGIIEKGTNMLILVSQAQIEQIQLAELPANFYVKPTLRWRLLAAKKATYPMLISYLTAGLKWDVTYNGTWDGKNLLLNSWVTIDNQSGKGFKDVTLKLIAGDVNRVQPQYYGGGYGKQNRSYAVDGMSVSEPVFAEKAFADMHMYTLSEPATFADKQIKQLSLYPAKTVKAETLYEYQVQTDAVYTKIKFINKAENGLGLPLPKGVFKIYREDNDKNLEFIGEDDIDHTPVNEEVVLTTGKAFDLVGKTLTVASRDLGGSKYENDLKVTLRNNSRETKVIRIVYQRFPNVKLLYPSTPITSEKDNKVVWEQSIKPDGEFNLTFTERYN